MMECLPKGGMFRRSRFRLSSPREYPPQSPLTPQHPKAKLKLVNGIFRRSFSKSNASSRQSVDGTSDDVARECTVADSFEDIIKENEWFLLNIEEPLPRARSKHAAVASEGNMYVVGGDSVDGQLGDVQVFNLDNFSWKQLCSAGLDKVRMRLREPGISESGPLLPAGGPRLLAPFVGMWNGKLIAVGCEVSIPNDDSPVSVHAFDPSDCIWTVLKPAGEVPDARVGYRIVQVKSKLVMFAGEDASGRIVDDVCTLDLEKLAWDVLQTKGAKPAPRKYHAIACYGGRYIWVYGGKSYSTYYNDIYCLDLECLMWTNVTVEGAVPTVPRAGHVCIMQGKNLYIIGGENRGDEIVDTLAFDIQKRAWSVVTTVNAMSPLAHNGLSVLKVKHESRRYLVAFGGHGILLSCQMYALLLPASDPNSGCDSLSSLESLSVKSISKNSTPQEEKTSPTDPFSQFHGSAPLSSSSLESDSAAAAADDRLECSVEESSPLSRKQRGQVNTGSSSPDFDSWERTPIRDIAFSKFARKPESVRTRSISASEEIYKLSRNSDNAQHKLLPLLSQKGAGQSEEDFTQNNSQSGRFDSKDGTKSLRALFQSRDPSPIDDSLDTDLRETAQKNDPHASEKKTRVHTGAVNEQLRLVVRAITELQDTEKSRLAKDEDLNIALQTIKELQEEIQELRRNKGNRERKMRQRFRSEEPMIDKQSERENPAEIEARTEVARGQGQELPEEIQELRRNKGNQERKMRQTLTSEEPMTDKQSERENPAEIEARTEVARGQRQELPEEIQELRRNEGNQETKMRQRLTSEEPTRDKQSERENPAEIEARTEVARGQRQELQEEIQELRRNKGNQERKMRQTLTSEEPMTDKQSERENPAEIKARTEVARGQGQESQEKIKELRRNIGNQERKMRQRLTSEEPMTDKQSERENPAEIKARTEVARGQGQELQEEIQELRRNKGNQERKMRQRLTSEEPMTDKQSERENPAEIEARTEVARGQGQELPEEIQELRRNKGNQERKMRQTLTSEEPMTDKQSERENPAEIKARTEVARGQGQEMQEEIQELRRNKGNQERKMRQRLTSEEPMTDKQSERENPAEIEARTEVARGQRQELQEEIQELRRNKGNQKRKMRQKLSEEPMTGNQSGREKPAEVEAKTEVTRGQAKEIQELRRKKRNQERKMHQKANSGELMSGLQSGRENAVEIEAKGEVARGRAKELHEEIHELRINKGNQDRKVQPNLKSGELETDMQSQRANLAEIETAIEAARGPVKQLHEEIQELRRYNGNEERKNHQEADSGELITDEQSASENREQSPSENPAEIEARTEVARSLVKEVREEIQDRTRTPVNHERKIEQKSNSGELMIEKQSGKENAAAIEARNEVAQGPGLIRKKSKRRSLEIERL